MYFMFLKIKNASHENGTEYSNLLKGFKNKTPARWLVNVYWIKHNKIMGTDPAIYIHCSL